MSKKSKLRKTETETKPTEEKPTEEKPTEEKPTETKPTEEKPTETKPTEEKPTETKPTETKPTETKPTETKPTETKPTETKPTETKPTEEKPTEKGVLKKTTLKKSSSPKSSFKKSSFKKSSFDRTPPKKSTFDRRSPKKIDYMRCEGCKKKIMVEQGESYYIHNNSKYCYECYVALQMDSTIDSIISPKLRMMIASAIFGAMGIVSGLIISILSMGLVVLPDLIPTDFMNLFYSILPIPQSWLIYPLVTFNIWTAMAGFGFLMLSMIGVSWVIISGRRAAEMLIVSAIGGTACLGGIFFISAFWLVLSAVLIHPELSKLVPTFMTKMDG